ncbi:MAG: AMP-binding protein [Acidimicrobiales bacterium]
MNLAALVEAQAAATPDAAAVDDSRATLTYRELDRRAAALAAHLPGDVPIAVLAERSPEMVVALLAVLKAGAACLPLDPLSPPERLRYLLADSTAPLVLAQASLLEPIAGAGVPVLPLDSPGENASPHPAPTPPRDDGLAFLLYTSGSTGRPKGVMLTHRGLVTHCRTITKLYALGPSDRVLQFCSPSFDVSIEEIFPTLASGGTVVLRDDAVPVLGRRWLDWLAAKRITVLNLPTAYWHEWARDLAALGAEVPPAVRLVTVGGEKALGRAYRQWQQVVGHRVRWLNAYGPTEATIGATVYEPDPDGTYDWVDPPIGRPLEGTTVHVLDLSARSRPAGAGPASRSTALAGCRQVGVGEEGELFIGGDRLAAGYWQRTELTDKRFPSDPFTDDPAGRLYRTGDVVRIRPDGDLEFVGRVDNQVKVRGFRIEPGEVETALLAHPEVADAVVIGREDTPGVRRLVAYVVPARPARGSPAAASLRGPQLRHFLGSRLPRSMMPTQFVVLDALPTTLGGKVDRQALPAPTPSAGGAGANPSTPTETALAAIWSQVLNIDGIGVDDDFFDLGGHSLLATQVVVQVRETLGIEVPLGSLFDASTLGDLAAAIDLKGTEAEAGPALVAVPRGPEMQLPLTPGQEQMWHLEAAKPPTFYNITAVRRFDGEVDVAALRRALGRLVDRHESLRTRFGVEDGRLFQQVLPSAEVELPVADISEEDLERQIAADNGEPFDPEQVPLLNTRLYRTPVGGVLVATFDHLIADGTSTYVFLSEVGEAYAAECRGEAPALAPRPVQFADFALWQAGWLTEGRLAAQLEYWQEKLAAMPLGPALPFDHVPEVPTRRILCRDLAVPADAYRGLRRLAGRARGTLFVVATAVVQAALAILGGQNDVVLSTTLSGRQRAGLEGVIGYFAGIGRIRTDLSGDPTFEEVLGRARESVVGLFDHQDVPFMRIRATVSPDFPVVGGGGHPLAALPVELQYFHAGADAWAPGLGVVERPGGDPGPDRLFFRGQLHPLSLTLFDDGDQLWGEINYKADFYEATTMERLAVLIEGLLAAVPQRPDDRLSDLAAALDLGPPASAAAFIGHRPVGTWRLELLPGQL